ncbi:hypothetical protein HRbin36_01578 [bacterium HR36]|nr:hypothetical protein HRbin36_01578 [bacterium HR36]
MDGQPAVVGVGPQGELVLGIPASKGHSGNLPRETKTAAAHRVEFDWSAFWERRGPEMVANLELPPAQLAKLELAAPASFRVSLRGGEASLVHTEFLAGQRDWLRYLWALGSGSSRLEVVLQPLAASGSGPIVHVHQQVQHVFESAGWQSRFQLELETVEEALPAITLTVPAGLQVESVQERLRGLSADHWKQQKTAQGTQIEVRLPGLARRAELEVVCRPRSFKWDAPVRLDWLQVEPASSLVTSISVRWPQGLTLSSWVFGDFQPQQPPQLGRDGFWQLVLEQSVPGLLGPASLPRVTVRRQTADLSVQAQLYCELGLLQSRMQAQLTWNVRSGSVFRLGVRVPADWTVQDAQISEGADTRDWVWRREGQRLWAERQEGTLQAPATARMTLELRSRSPQPDFSRSGTWPLPELVPEQATWAQATWYLTLERVQDARGRRYPLGTLWPAAPWSMRLVAPTVTETAKPAADYAFTGPLPSNFARPTGATSKKATPDYVFTGPLPSNSHLRLIAAPAMYRMNCDTLLDWRTAVNAPETATGAGRLHVRWSVQVEPVTGLVRSASVQFPGEMPDLDWRIVSGDADLQQVARRITHQPLANRSQTWTVFEFRFDAALLAPVRLEADWLYPCPEKKLAADAQEAACLCELPVPCGQPEQWWEGRIDCAPSIPSHWTFSAVWVGQAADKPAGKPLQALPWLYAQPALIRVGALPPSPQRAVIQGALLGISWDSQAQLRCDYWAWTQAAEHAASVLPSATTGASYRLRLPRGAMLRTADIWHIVEGQAVRVSDAVSDSQSGQVIFTATSTGPAIFHVRYSLPAQSWYWVISWPDVWPTWEDGVTVLGRRIWARVPGNWSPVFRQGVFRHVTGGESLATSLVFGDANSPARAVAAWWKQPFTDMDAHPGVSGNEPELEVPVSFKGFAWWEIGESAWAGGMLWVQRDRAHTAAAAVGVGILIAGYVLRRRVRWWFLSAAGLLMLASLLALLWLPSDLATLSYWPLGALGIVIWLAVRAATEVESPGSQELAVPEVFSTPKVASACWWLAWGVGLLAAQSFFVAADELNQAKDRPPPSEPQKERPTITLLHYTEGQGPSSRHWVLVPLDWWQRWQQQIQPAHATRSWLITASRWQVEMDELPSQGKPAGKLARAVIAWDLEVQVFAAEVSVSLAVGGIRWQSAEEVLPQGKETLDISPLEPGVALRLRGPGTRRLRLVGHADIQQSGSEYWVRWKTPALAFAQLQANLPGYARRVECLGARGRVHIQPATLPPPRPVTVWQCQADLGPTSEVRLAWLVPETAPPEWTVEEFHWLRPEKWELRWLSVCQLEQTRGQLSEVRLAVPQSFLVRSVEVRPAAGQERGTSAPRGGSALGQFSWRIAEQAPYRILSVQLAQPVAGSCTLYVEYILDPASCPIWAATAPAVAMQHVLAPAALIRPMPPLWPLGWLERQSLRQMTLLVGVPHVMLPQTSKRRGAWLSWHGDERLALRVLPRGGAKSATPPPDLLARWPIKLAAPAANTDKLPTSPQRNPGFCQLLAPYARLLVVLLAPTPSAFTVSRTIQLELDWYQAQAQFRLEVQAHGASLPVAVTALLPPAFRVTEVSGKELTDWLQEGSQLRLWLRPAQTAADLQIRGSFPISGSGEQRTISLPVISLPGFRPKDTQITVSAAAGLRFQLVKSQALAILSQTENKASYQAQAAAYSGVLEVHPAGARYTVQLNSSLRREPDWFWETQAECRSTAGPIRSVLMHVLPWSGPPPLVVSEELHQVRVEPASQGNGYVIRVEFPEAASLADQAVRFRILGRLDLNAEKRSPLPLFHLPEAQSVRHRLMAWPRDMQLDNATAENDAYRLPSEPNAAAVVLQPSATRTSAVRVFFAQLDVWHHHDALHAAQLTLWLVHPPRAWLTLRLPASAQLLETTLNHQPAFSHSESDGSLHLALLSVSGLSCLRLTYLLNESPNETPLAEVDGQPLRTVWLQRWYPLQNEMPTADSAQMLMEQQLAFAEAGLMLLRQELPFVTGESTARLGQVAGLVNELLQASRRTSALPESLSKRWEALRRQWSELTASPRFDPIRRLPNQPGVWPATLLVKPSMPFLAAQPTGQLWLASNPWPPQASSLPSWDYRSLPWLATLTLALALLAGIGVLLLRWRRRICQRFAPESLVALAVFWGVFLEPTWPALAWLTLAIYWRYRRWRQHRTLLQSQNFVVAASR